MWRIVTLCRFHLGHGIGGDSDDLDCLILPTVECDFEQTPTIFRSHSTLRSFRFIGGSFTQNSGRKSPESLLVQLL